MPYIKSTYSAEEREEAENKEYETRRENVKKILNMLDGMSEWEWNRAEHCIDQYFSVMHQNQLKENKVIGASAVEMFRHMI